MKRVLFYCQHVLGIGHLVRTTEIVRALATQYSVYLVSGGEEVPEFECPSGVELINLAPLRTDADFGDLEVCDGHASVPEMKEARKRRLLNLMDVFAPDVFIIELFPFGRKRFDFELIPAITRLRESRPGAKVVCSVRDILVSKRDQTEHEERVCRILNQYFDLVLVHSDPRFQRLEETFSRVSDVACPVRYTGYVVQRQARTEVNVPKDPFVLASIGSGRYVYGHQLIEALLRAAPKLREQVPHKVLIFAGPFIPDKEFQRLNALAREHHNVDFERFTPDLLPFMQHAALSISMGGYNTLMNVLLTEAPALVFPYTSNGDQEQMMRAEKLAKLGAIRMIHPSDLEPESLTAVITSTLRAAPARFGFDMRGAENSLRMLQESLEPKLEAAAG